MARPMTPEAAELRRQVVAAVIAAADQGRVPDRTAIARQFQGHAPASTLARWIAAAIEEAHHNLARDNSGAPEPPAVMVNSTPESDRPSPSNHCGEVAPELSNAAVGATGYHHNDDILPAAPASGDLLAGWSDAELGRLDQWRQYQIGEPSRAEAVRMLVRAALHMAPRNV